MKNWLMPFAVAISLLGVAFFLAACGNQDAPIVSSESPQQGLSAVAIQTGNGSNLAGDAGATNPRAVVATKTVNFSGHDWALKVSSGKVGPGPNLFSDSPQNIWVDSLKRLHLRITKQKGRWYCAEVVSVESFSYGTYRFYLDSPVDAPDPNVVLGLFTWNDDTSYNHREIDIEFSRWGSANNQNAQYVVQPYTLPQNILRFQEPSGLNQSTHSFLWKSDAVSFKSLKGLNATAPDSSYIIKQWVFTGTVPQAGGENARMNLWLFRGRPPTNGQEAEIIVNKFEIVH